MLDTIQHYTQADLFRMARAGEVDKLITLVLTFQRRAEDLAKQAEVLQRERRRAP